MPKKKFFNEVKKIPIEKETKLKGFFSEFEAKNVIRSLPP